MNVVAPQLSVQDAVRSPRGMRWLAAMLILIFLTLPIVLIFVPWQQNVAASGRVTALNPLDRTQVLPAPVSGRIVELNVREGDKVKENDVLAVIRDLDPDYAERLADQVKFAQDKVDFAEKNVRSYDDQVRSLEDAREQAINQANHELQVAIEKVLEQDQELIAFEAERDQYRLKLEAEKGMFEKDLTARLDVQQAETNLATALAKVEGSRTKVNQARNTELAKMASVKKIGNEQKAKVDKAVAEREEAETKLASARKELTDALSKRARQLNQEVLASRDGVILRVHAALNANYVQEGQPLIELIPDSDDLGVEVWVRGIDAPLVKAGRQVRLQFEGWPAVQFVGWPSVAVGTFGGVVDIVDSFGTANGKFRVLIRPDENDQEWPETRYLRQGVRTTGWLLLDEVPLWFEVWRQLNAFPPTVTPPEDGAPKMDKGAGGGKKEKAK